ncbi:MAG: LptF/LptG family permease [Bacteroidetes bacterium]|uniref:LptF/LptG family permease n=1 Tax=Phnomibacter sp. TaxID=2836217 RepID=UPI002FDEFBD5|nr:LptF/LptG family permease [Bacteroidota bacterium]
MIKQLDKLILRAFIGPFLATFLIAIFVLILQFFWLWIDDFVGKGIDMATLGEVVLYVAASWVPVALPLAMLLSTIMTFGNLGESYELVAIKSAGISLLRFMRPIFLASLLIVGVAFLFNNNIIPIVNLKLNKLKYEIVYSKPAFDIKPGVFYDNIEGYVIKLGSKENDGQLIKDVIIYEKGNYLQDNLLLADSGSMTVSNDKRFLKFHLKHGTRYEERGMRSTTNTELIRVGFDEYEKIFDLTSFFRVQSNDSLFKDNYRMLSVRQLKHFMDSVVVKKDSLSKRIRNEVSANFSFATQYDSGKLKLPIVQKAPKNLQAIFPDSTKTILADMALSKINAAKTSMDLFYADYNSRSREIREYMIGLHQKFALSFACFVMFLIGAPLGSIIRKGGIGTPLVFAVIFFAIFHLLNTTGEKLAKEAVLSPFVGTWLPSIVLVPIGIFLGYKAMRDSQLFNKEFYYRTAVQFKKFIRRNATKNNA